MCVRERERRGERDSGREKERGLRERERWEIRDGMEWITVDYDIQHRFFYFFLKKKKKEKKGE